MIGCGHELLGHQVQTVDQWCDQCHISLPIVPHKGSIGNFPVNIDNWPPPEVRMLPVHPTYDHLQFPFHFCILSHSGPAWIHNHHVHEPSSQIGMLSQELLNSVDPV